LLNRIILEDAREICSVVNLEPLRDSSILITGASGLIGTYLLASLVCLHEQGIPFRVYAQHFSDLPAYSKELIQAGGFKAIRFNLADHDEYKRIPEADFVVHSAGYAQPSLFMANPISTIQINTAATIALLNHLRQHGKFLFVSSSEIYSGLKKHDLAETDIGCTTPFHPRASYIEGKRCGEAICNSFRLNGTEAKSARVSLAYGPGTRKHDKRALNSFIEQALLKKRIELLDSGAAMRTYCYVADTVELLWRILLFGKEPIYNVGGKSTLSIAELAKVVAQISEAEVVFPTAQAEIAGAPEEVGLDLTRAEMEFGKLHYTALEEGIRTTIEWQQELYFPDLRRNG
jgi:UDP-glucuronate decarboxylase